MDIYLFSFLTIAFGSLVITILVMYAHSHKLQDDMLELDEAQAVSMVALENTERRYKERFNKAKDEIKNLEREIRKLQHERLACVTCTPTLKERA